MAETYRVEHAPLPEEGKAVRVMVDGKPVAVFRVGGALHGLDARCTHVGGPLDQGSVHAGRVMCPWHGSTFEIESGRVVQGPATRPAVHYRVRTEGETLVLERD